MLGVLVTCAFAALADIPPPDTSGCRDKALKQACTTDEHKPGSCQSSTCSRRDYSSGMPPKSVPYECLRCLPAGASDAGTARPDAGR